MRQINASYKKFRQIILLNKFRKITALAIKQIIASGNKMRQFKYSCEIEPNYCTSNTMQKIISTNNKLTQIIAKYNKMQQIIAGNKFRPIIVSHNKLRQITTYAIKCGK